MLEEKGGQTRSREAADEEKTPEEEDEEYEFEREEKERETRRGNAQLLTIIQIVGCAAVLVAALAIRFSGGELYQKAREWYLSASNDSLIAQEDTAQAKRAVIGLWDNLTSSRGTESENISGASSSQDAASSRSDVSSKAAPSSQAAVSSQAGTSSQNTSSSQATDDKPGA